MNKSSESSAQTEAREREMGKGGNSEDVVASKEEVGEENMAAWLLGIKTLKIQPFILPPLGTTMSPFSSIYELLIFNLQMA